MAMNPFEQQQFGTSGVERVNSCCSYHSQLTVVLLRNLSAYWCKITETEWLWPVLINNAEMQRPRFFSLSDFRVEQFRTPNSNSCAINTGPNSGSRIGLRLWRTTWGLLCDSELNDVHGEILRNFFETKIPTFYEIV